jgi:hypothetical protein
MNDQDVLRLAANILLSLSNPTHSQLSAAATLLLTDIND